MSGTMQPKTAMVCIAAADGSWSCVKISNVKKVTLEKQQDVQGKAVWYYSAVDLDGDEVAAFPMDAVIGWWYEETAEFAQGAG